MPLHEDVSKSAGRMFGKSLSNRVAVVTLISKYSTLQSMVVVIIIAGRHVNKGVFRSSNPLNIFSKVGL